MESIFEMYTKYIDYIQSGCPQKANTIQNEYPFGAAKRPQKSILLSLVFWGSGVAYIRSCVSQPLDFFSARQCRRLRVAAIIPLTAGPFHYHAPANLSDCCCQCFGIVADFVLTGCGNDAHTCDCTFWVVLPFFESWAVAARFYRQTDCTNKWGLTARLYAAYMVVVQSTSAPLPLWMIFFFVRWRHQKQ